MFRIDVRDGLPRDRGMVVDNWIRSFRSSRYAGPYTYDAYHAACRLTVEDILSRSGVNILVAINADEPDHKFEILGYIVYEDSPDGQSLHWVYVKDGLRRQGLALFLLEKAGLRNFTYTFRTYASDKALQELARTGRTIHCNHRPQGPKGAANERSKENQGRNPGQHSRTTGISNSSTKESTR